MSNSNETDIISSLYPPPPPYFKFFTDENINRVREWKREQEDNDIDMDAEDEKSETKRLPDGKLKFIIPPETPEGTHYRGYGNLWSFEDKLPSLSESGWRQLYEENDEEISSTQKIEQLHKLMDSLLLNFLELLGIVSTDPQHFHIKIEDLKLVLININHLLNTYRPHQSRESLIMLLKKQIEEKKSEIAKIDNVSDDIKTRILKLFNNNAIEVKDSHFKRTDDSEKIDSAKSAIIERMLSKQ